jgi:O-6-methylguanine DNA methyltransferase
VNKERMAIPIKKILPAIGTLEKTTPGPQDLTQDEVVLLEQWANIPFNEIKKVLSPQYNKLLLKEGTQDVVADNIFFHRMAPEEKPGVSYSLEETPYGQVIIASTSVGVCYLVFYSGSIDRAKSIVQRHFPGSVVITGTDVFQQDALAFIQGKTDRVVHLHVKGSEERLRVWEELIKVPGGMITSYGALAKNAQCMAQDVGVAMGDNRIALLIPCHRVIKSTGEIGLYHYGSRLKRAIILREVRRRSEIRRRTNNN